MDELGWTQKKMAETLKCSQQHISVLLNGRANMTLETIAKLETALDISLLDSILTKLAGNPTIGYLNDSAVDPPVFPLETKHLVNGYAPRKKKGPKKK